MRPMFRYFGGKAQQSSWIVRHLPPHRRYVEPFGGAASVLMAKSRARAEMINDVDDDIHCLYRVLRNDVLATRLDRMLCLTPFSRAEFEEAWDKHPSDDLVERARKLIVRGAMSFGTGNLDGRNGRATDLRDYTGNARTSLPAHDWSTYGDSIARFTERLAGVVVERRDAVDVMRRHDCSATVHYVDPPYVPSTRGGRRGYRHELDEPGHQRLLDCLLALRGMVVLSGYACAMYDEALVGWRRIDRVFVDQARKDRVESLWLSPTCAAALEAAEAQLVLC